MDTAVKKKYIVVTPFFPSEQEVYGSYIYDLVKAIIRNSDYEVVVFKPKALRDKRWGYIYGGIKVFYFPSLFMPSYFFNGLTNFLNDYLFVRTLKKNISDIENIAVVHCHTASFASFGIALKKNNQHIKVVLQHHDPDPYQVVNGRFASFLPNLLFRAYMSMSNFKKIDCHVCVSGFVENNLLTFPKISDRVVYEPYLQRLLKLRHIKYDTSGFKTYVLYNGVVTDAFRPFKAERENFTIGCVANYVNWKDHATLLEAIRKLKNKDLIPGLKVKLIGHGPLEKVLREYVKKNNLKDIVYFENEVDHRQLPHFFNSLDLFVLPSYFEGFGCVYTEAAACGVPFIMCEGQGASEYIFPSDADKWLIKKGDCEALANRIYQYYLNRYEQKLSKTFDIDELISDYLDYIK